MPMSAQWSSGFRGRGFKPAKPTFTYSGGYQISNYNSSLTYTLSNMTRSGANLTVPSLPAGGGTYGVSYAIASQGINSDTGTLERIAYSYYNTYYYYDCSYTTYGWCGCGCECGGGGCGCYPAPTGASWGQCGCPGPMCWYGSCGTYHPQTCQGSNGPYLTNPGNGYTNNGVEWYKGT